MANNLFSQLMGNLKKANSNPPAFDTIALGFTKAQMLKMDMKKPRLIWYDAKTKSFYDQGDSTKIKKKDWTKINATNYKKDKCLTHTRKQRVTHHPLFLYYASFSTGAKTALTRST